MTPRIHTHARLTAALAVTAALVAAAPAQSMPIDLRTPDARDAAGATKGSGGTYRPVVPENGMDHRATEAALAQEQYYESHAPATRYSGRDLRTVDARDAPDAPGGAVTRVTAPAKAEPAGSGGLEWDDAAVGAAGMLGIVLVLAGGAAAVSRRRTPATP